MPFMLIITNIDRARSEHGPQSLNQTLEAKGYEYTTLLSVPRDICRFEDRCGRLCIFYTHARWFRNLFSSVTFQHKHSPRRSTFLAGRSVLTVNTKRIR